MIKIFNKRHRKGKGGFTLMEVIIALGLFCLLSLVVAVMFELVFKLRINTDDVNKQMNKQATILDNGAGEEYNEQTTDQFEIKFDGIDESIKSNGGEKVANADANDYRIPIRVFD